VTAPAAAFGEHSKGSPLVSVVLATYNRANVLEDTLRMVFAQTLDDFELIVCDDCSTDGTPVVMAEWAKRDPRILYVRQPRNLGLAGNVRRGIDLARAEFVAVLYDGDVYDACLLERWVAALRACPDAAFVFNAYNRLGADGRIEVTFREHLESCVPGRVLLERLYFRRWHFDSPVWGTVMLRRSKYIAAGGLDTRFSFVADVDLYLRLAETNCVAYVPEPLIGLASREAVPKLFRPPPKRLVRRAFREARARHYRGRQLRLLAEMLRHWTFTAMDVAVGPMLTAVSGWQGAGPAYRLRRRLIRRRSRDSAYLVQAGEQTE
jgi:glycosyltransferase involved in cell wall biosynthesis